MLREGWLKDQMQKAAEDVEKWPNWMVRLDQAETKMQSSLYTSSTPHSEFVEPHAGSKKTAKRG